MNTPKSTSRHAGKRIAYYALAAAAVAGTAAFAAVQLAGGAAASSPRRPLTPSQALQSFATQREQYLRAHPLSSAQAKADQQKVAARIKAVEQQASQQPPAQLPSGLSQGTRGGPFSGCQFKPQSEYVAPPAGTAGTQVLAFAGQAIDLATCKPTHGAIYLFEAGPAVSPQLQQVGVFDAPTTAPLKIVSVTGNTLNLQAITTGQTFTFNLTSHEYAS